MRLYWYLLLDINLQWLIRKWSVQKGIDHTYGSDWNNVPCPGGTIVQSYVLLLARMPIATLWIACIFYDNFHKRHHDLSRSIVYQHYSRKILSWNDLSYLIIIMWHAPNWMTFRLSRKECRLRESCSLSKLNRCQVSGANLFLFVMAILVDLIICNSL